MTAQNERDARRLAVMPPRQPRPDDYHDTDSMAADSSRPALMGGVAHATFEMMGGNAGPEAGTWEYEISDGLSSFQSGPHGTLFEALLHAWRTQAKVKIPLRVEHHGNSITVHAAQGWQFEQGAAYTFHLDPVDAYAVKVGS